MEIRPFGACSCHSLLRRSCGLLFCGTQLVVEEINELLDTNYCLNTKGTCWFVEVGENLCMNGLWSEEMLERMYDQTSGYLQAIRTLKIEGRIKVGEAL